MRRSRKNIGVDILSICSGIGGLDLGLKLAISTARTVCYLENEAYCCEILVRRMEEKCLDEAPVWTDLKTFDGKPWRGKVDCVIGGYPCQPFSVAGKRAGTDDPRHLWPHVARILAETEASLGFFENVAGHLQLGFPQVIKELEGMGYTVAAGLYSAAEVGATHRRERLFFMAYRKSGDREISIQQGRSRQPCLESRRSGGELGDTRKPGLEGPSKRHAQAWEARRQIPTWPPGPASLGWTEILARWPELIPALVNTHASRHGREGNTELQTGQFDQPSSSIGRHKATQPPFRGMAHGPSLRVERLRGLGNSVLPVVAAYAFASLWKRLKCEGMGRL